MTKVENGKAEFKLAGYILSEPLKFQFTPMASVETKLNDDWWTCAISGSDSYGNDENNMVCDFIANNAKPGCKIVVSKDKHGAPNWKSTFPCYPNKATRKYATVWTECFTIEY